jgi:hypothetical protein
MSTTFNRQPDYENWPQNEFTDAKRSRLESFQWEYDVTGTLNERDFTYLMAKNKQFWCLFDFTTNERLRVEAELMCMELEIEDLKRQLKEKNAGK